MKHLVLRPIFILLKTANQKTESFLIIMPMKQYKIYLFNLQESTHKMWCFLGESASNISAKIYGNSNTFLSVPLYTGIQQSYFIIPLQYIIELGASVQPVGSNIFISSSVRTETALGMKWLASYFQEPNERIPPTISENGVTSNKNLEIATNAYNKNEEPINSWYGSMTYGLESPSGFTGLTWSPNPSTYYSIEPEIIFHIAIGPFSADVLVDMEDVKRHSANVLNSDFDANVECTVIYNADGTWSIKQGYTPPEPNILSILSKAHLELSIAHKKLVQLILSKRV